MIKYIFILLTATVMLNSCWFDRGRRVRGNGNITTQQRSLSGFRGVESEGSFDIFLSTDSNFSVRIEADENILPIIETTIERGNLKIGTDWGYSLRPSRPVKIYVSAPVFNAARTSGSGNIAGNTSIHADGDLDLGVSGSGNIDLKIEATNVSADISGSGSIKLAGTAKSLRGSIAGSGDIRAAELRTSTSKFSIAGSGNASVHADEQLDADIAGSGDVRYSGNPKLSTQIAGSGSVKKIE